MNEDIYESSTDPHDRKSYLKSTSGEHSSNMFFGTTYNRPVTVKDMIHTLNANQEKRSYVTDTSPDTVEIIPKDRTGNKQRRTLAMAILIAVIFIITAIGITGYYLNTYGRVKIEDSIDETTTSTSEAITTNTAETEHTSHAVDEPETYEIISRSEYEALSPNATLVPLNTPVKRVIIAHTAGENASCTDIESCSKKVRSIQIYHMVDLKFDDIGLNFLVGGDGNVYEGRGYHRGAHTCGYNDGSICISLIGNFEQYKATEKQLEAVKGFIVYLKEANKIDQNYDLFGQIQLNGHSSPGEHVFSLIKDWPRFNNAKMERYTCN